MLPDESEPAVTTSGLTKRHGRTTVVDGLDLCIPRGTVAGFVGPNGAGKTTTLRMLLGLIKPSAGTGTVLGQPLDSPRRYLSRVGALIENPAVYPGLSAARNLAVMAAAGGHDPRRIPAVLERVELDGRANDPVKAYSFGMRQRLGIASALLGDPELLVLDEPTNGLDPGGIKEMRSLVRSLADEGPTVLISSHLLAEVEQACDWIVMIERGRQVFQGPTRELLGDGVQLTVVPEDPADLDRLEALLRARDLVPVREGERLRVGGPRGLAATVGRLCLDERIVLVELNPGGASLEDRYAALVEGGIR